MSVLNQNDIQPFYINYMECKSGIVVFGASFGVVFYINYMECKLCLISSLWIYTSSVLY